MTIPLGRRPKVTEDAAHEIDAVLKQAIALGARRSPSMKRIQGALREYLIRKIGGENPERPISEIERMVEDEDGRLPGISTITKYVKKRWDPLQEQHRAPGPLDQAWSIGDCRQCPIPHETVDTVLSLLRRMEPFGRYLTRRHVQWLSIIHSMLSKQLRDTYPDTEQRELALLLIVALYNLEDQIANIDSDTDGNAAVTFSLDQAFAIGQDVTFPTILREWLSAFCPTIAEEIEKEGGHPTDQKNSAPGLDRANTPLGKFQRLLLDALTDSRKRQVVVDYVAEHPEVTPSAQQWLAFNLRRWLVKNWREQHRKQ